MADTAVDTGLSTSSNTPGFTPYGPFWISTTKGAVFFVDANSDMCARITTDGGASWGSLIAAEAGTVATFSVFFGRQNPGNSGTLVYAAWSDSALSRIRYAEFDIDAGTWSSPVDAGAATSIAGGTMSFIAVSRSGNRIVGHVRNANNTLCRRSTDGSSWSNAAAPFESNVFDDTMGVSVNTGDNDDAGILFLDRSATELSVKMYDWSADTWTETAIGTSAEDFATYPFGQCTRVSDGVVIVAAWTQVDNAASDLKVYSCALTSISTPTISTLTNIITDQAESIGAGVFVDPNTDDIYVAYATGTTYTSSLNVYYKKSTDDGSTWGSQTAYGEDADADIRTVTGGACGTAGGRFQPLFFNDDLNDIFVNLTNDIEIAAAGGGDPEGLLVGGKLIRGGLLMRGALAR